jgi:hypothetical protein
MAVSENDIKRISAELGGECTVLDTANLAPNDARKFNAVVSFNCVNIFHPEISKMQANAPLVEKLLKNVKKEDRIIYKRDRHFNGAEVMHACEFGRLMLTDKIKILISIPCYERVCKETLKSIYDLIIPEWAEAEFNFQSGYTVVQARNRQVRETLAGGFDYTLFVDSDVILPQILLMNLLRANADLATGWYIKKIPGGPQISEIYARKRFNEELENVSQEELLGYAGQIVPIGGCGFGCTLVKNTVFADLKEHEDNWFEYVEKKEDGKFYICSEDLKFCERLRDKGKSLVCDAGLRCYHIGQCLF